MKHYPSFDGKVIDIPIVAFDKLDGQNIRCQWDRKHGLHKFGSRKVLLGEDHPTMGRAIALTLEKFGESLPRSFRDERLEFVTCYFEFHGEKSFAGMHELDDPTLTTTLIDVDVYKRGCRSPGTSSRCSRARWTSPGCSTLAIQPSPSLTPFGTGLWRV